MFKLHHYHHHQDSSSDEKLKGNVKTILSEITGLIAPPADAPELLRKFWDRLDKVLPARKRNDDGGEPVPEAATSEEKEEDEDLHIRVECDFILPGEDIINSDV